jgi:Protein of unknown function (DUF3768)
MEQAEMVGTRSVAIRQLNDYCRKTFTGCTVMVTPSVQELPDDKKAQLLNAVRTFDTFDSGNDPYREHDFGCVELFGERWFFKFDYYSPDMRTGSDDPSDIEKTRRVLTILAANEY